MKLAKNKFCSSFMAYVGITTLVSIVFGFSLTFAKEKPGNSVPEQDTPKSHSTQKMTKKPSKSRKKDKHQYGIREIHGLGFPTGIAGINQTLVTLPDERYAAIYEARGEPFETINISVVEQHIFMTNTMTTKNKKRNPIRVGQFTSGGGVDRDGNGFFNREGLLSDIRFGATAHINSNHSYGSYSGNATLRMVTQ